MFRGTSVGLPVQSSFFVTKNRVKWLQVVKVVMNQSIESKVKSRIYGHKGGWCFTLRDFADLGSPESIKISVHRLSKEASLLALDSGV